MIPADLQRLVSRAGANEVLYEDPFLAGRPLLLRSACPRAYSPVTPVLFVHHGDLRNAAEFRLICEMRKGFGTVGAPQP